MTLYELPLNQPAHISYLPANFALSAQLIAQDFALKSEISLAHKAPFNGPLTFHLHGTKICLSASIAKQINIELLSK
ncbi:ferrous iron transport protein A [Colwellia sp. MB02u-6]|jgi:ferrous iron transport protein A|uniref:FeoA family protein n=1 Tax=Colwellia sp. MB02u-6 TaxID=2759824 RepID=UPI0015F4B03E|nr:FeoA family protein [Colwellia sp. MB02u-6]MBA6328658.1 ferrous iron transport protein A [Colwellia sp. MB02u-6]